MRLVLIHRESLQRIGADLVNELDNLVARIRGTWRLEHHDDGSHSDITADSITIGEQDDTGVRLWLSGPDLLGQPTLSIHDGDLTNVGRARLRVAYLEASEDLYVLNNARVDGALIVGEGSVSEPSLSFVHSPDTGFYNEFFGTFSVAQDGVNTMTFRKGGGIFGYYFDINEVALGTGALTGMGLAVRRNTSGNGAAGWVLMERRDGTDQFIWHDAAGLLRTGATPPTEDNTTVSDTSGTVVGDQTSQRSAKHIIGERTDTARALHTIVNTPVYDFTYRDGRYNKEKFTGITTDDSPVFAKDQGRSFNEINAFGYLVNAVKEQQKQIEALRAELSELRESRMTRAVRWIKRLWRTRT